jgi:hypothetical protein
MFFQPTLAELLKLQKSQFPEEPVRKNQFPEEPVRSVSRGACKNKSLINSLCNLPEVLAIAGINDTALGGLFL